MSRDVRQKGITDWKPPFQSSIAEVASNNPISSVVSLGIVPAVGALAGKVGNLISAAVTPDDRSLAQRVSDNVRPVATRTGQDLASFTTGIVGTSKPLPAKQPKITDIPATGFGKVGMKRLGIADLSRMSDGSIPGASPRRAATATRPAVRKPITSMDAPTPALITAIEDSALQTPGEMVPGTGGKISRIGKVGAGEVNSGFGITAIEGYNLPQGGGIASNGDETFVLRGRTPGEEAQNQTQLAQQAVQPITAIAPAVATQPITMVGSSSMEPRMVAPSQAAFGPDYGNMTLSEVWAANRQQKDAMRNAEIANINSEIASRGTRDSIATIELPSKIDLNKASARHANVFADLGIFKAPAEVANIEATAALTKASTQEIVELMNPKKNTLLADAEYKTGMLKFASERLGILKEQIIQRVAQRKGDATDWAGITKSALEGIKLIDARAALSELSPEDIQTRKNLEEVYMAAFPRQKRTAYQPQQQLTVGDE